MYELIATAGEGSSIKPLEEGLYTGVCTKVVDLGFQHNEMYNKDQHKVMIGWDIAGEKIELQDGTKVNRTMWKEYTLFLNEKANLRQDLQAWRGKAFTPEELVGFNICSVIGAPCQVQIIHTERNGNKYANISAIIAMPKGMGKPEGNYPTTFFGFGYVDTYENVKDLPTWIQDKIKKSTDYKGSKLEKMLSGEESGYTEDEEYTDIDLEDDENLPF